MSPVRRCVVSGNGIGIGHEEEGLRILEGVYSGNGRGCWGWSFWDCRRLWILFHVIKIVWHLVARDFHWGFGLFGFGVVVRRLADVAGFRIE